MKNTQISNVMTICPVEGELFHPDGRTDMTILIAFFFGILRTRLKSVAYGDNVLLKVKGI